MHYCVLMVHIQKDFSISGCSLKGISKLRHKDCNLDLWYYFLARSLALPSRQSLVYINFSTVRESTD